MKKQPKRTALYFTLAMMTAGLFIAALAVAQNNDAQKVQTTPASTKSTIKPRDAAIGMASGKQAAAVQPYKDGEDMTTRSKSTTGPAVGTANVPPTPTTEDAAAKKHLAGVKYADRQVSGQQNLDGGSKDAAKSTTTPAGTNNGNQGASNGQDSKRVNKVDSFTVKQ